MCDGCEYRRTFKGIERFDYYIGQECVMVVNIDEHLKVLKDLVIEVIIYYDL